MPNQPIGQLNGKWGMLLKVALATYPFVLAWAVFVTVNIFELKAFASAGPRWTKVDAELQEKTIHEWVSAKIAAEVPPRQVIQRLDRLETVTDKTAEQVHKNAIALTGISSRLDAVLAARGP